MSGTGPGYPALLGEQLTTAELVGVMREVLSTLRALEANVDGVFAHYRSLTTRLAGVEIQQATCPDSCPFRVHLVSEDTTPVASCPRLKDVP